MNSTLDITEKMNDLENIVLEIIQNETHAHTKG